MAKTTAEATAAYLAHVFFEQGQPLTNLKLQKLLYYAQAWHLAIFEEPLFEGTFEAWVHGPVLPEIYHQYKKFGYGPIQNPGEVTLSIEVEEFLVQIIEKFGQFDAWELELMTHKEAPWLEARKGLPDDAPSQNPISELTMKAYYQSL